jgi:hypothetical protein
MKSSSTSNACTCDNGLIDVIGLCNPSDVTSIINNYPYWKQMYINENLTVPSQKPDIEQINSVDVSISIIRKEVIKTPRSYSNTTPPVEEPNLEGMLLSGRKLIIEGIICQKIVYTADNVTQPVHSVDFYIPFSSYIVVPKEVTFTNSNGTSITVDSLDVNYSVSSCVEDVFINLVDPRTIFKQVVLLLYAVPSQNA